MLKYGVRCEVPELRVREFDQGARPHGAYVLYYVGDFKEARVNPKSVLPALLLACDG